MQPIAPGTTAVRSGVCIFYYTLRALKNWLPGMDSHHDDRRNRPTGYFTSQGILKIVEPDGNAPSLAGCKPAVQSSTLRSLWKLAVETGAAPAVSSLTRRRVCCYSSRPKNWTQGMELHQPRQAYETRQSTGSPCSFKKWCGVTVMLRAVSMSFGVTVQVASLTIYRRVLDLE
jgi:hypothetical protein